MMEDERTDFKGAGEFIQLYDQSVEVCFYRTAGILGADSTDAAEAAADIVADAGTENRQCQTGNVLIGTQADCQKCI